MRRVPQPQIILQTFYAVESSTKYNFDEWILNIDSNGDSNLFLDPRSTCALLRACVSLLQVKNILRAQSFVRPGRYEGIEVACISKLPAGSGMGGSSILAACVIKAIASVLNITVSSEDLIYMVRSYRIFINTEIFRIFILIILYVLR